MTDGSIRFLAGLSLAALAAITGIVSYLHALTVVYLTGSAGLVAYLIPFVADLMIVTASLAILDAIRHHAPKPPLAMVSLVAGIGSTLAMNIVAGLHISAGGALVAALPPVAFVLSLETLMGIVRLARAGDGASHLTATDGQCPHRVAMSAEDAVVTAYLHARDCLGEPVSQRQLSATFGVPRPKVATLIGTLNGTRPNDAEEAVTERASLTGKVTRPVISSCVHPRPVGRLQGRPASWAGQDGRAVGPLLDRAHHRWQPCDIGVGDGGEESLRHRLIHRAVRPVEEGDHRGLGRWLLLFALDVKEHLTGSGQGVLAVPPSRRCGGGVEEGSQRRRDGQRAKDGATPLGVRRPPPGQGERQQQHILGEPRAEQPGAEIVACLGGPAHHRQQLAEPLPARGQHVTLDVRRMPGQQGPDRRQSTSPIGEHGAGGHLQHALPGHAQPVQHRQPSGRIHPQAAGGEVRDGGDLDLVADRGIPGDREPHRELPEPLRQSLFQQPADPRHLIAGILVDQQRQPAPPVVIAAHLVIQAEHIRP